MEEWINLIIFIIFGAVALFSRMLSRRGSKEEPDVVPEEITLPPWGNLPMEEEAPPPEFIEEEALAAPPEPTPTIQVASIPDPVEEETPAQSPADRTMPTIAGIPLSPQTFRQGIILAEILRRPKSLREPRQ